MSQTIGIIIGTALLSSIFTAGLLVLIAVKWLVPKIKESRGDVMGEFRQNVRDGALDAGTDLLPKFREQVKKGFEDAIKGTATGQAMHTARTAAKEGAGLFEDGLNTLLGRRGK